MEKNLNQCELIAEELAERVSSCKVQSLLRRIRWTGARLGYLGRSDAKTCKMLWI